MANQQYAVGIKISFDGNDAIAGVGKVNDGFKRIGDSAADSATRIDSSYSKTRRGLESISDQLAAAKRQFLEYISIQAGLSAGRELADRADRYANLSARLKLATGSELEYAKAQAEVYAISQRYSSSLDDNARLYSRIAPAARDAGKSQSELIQVIEGVNASLKTSGASAAEQSSTITQLSQSLASSTVQWEDFGNLADTNMRLVDAVAKQIGGSMGDLKQKMSDGLISNKMLFDAIIAASAQLKAEAATMPNTIGGAVQQVSNAWEQYIGKADQASGASRDVADAISGVAKNLGVIADDAIRVGEVVAVAIGVKSVTAMTAYVAEAAAAANSTLLFGSAAGALGGPVAAATVAIFAGAQALSVWRANMIAANDELIKLKGQGNGGALNTTDPSKIVGADLKAKVDEAKKSIGELSVVVTGAGSAMDQSGGHTKNYAKLMGDADQSVARASKNWKEYYTLAAQQSGLAGKEIEDYVGKMLKSKAAEDAAAESSKSRTKALSAESKEVKQLEKDQQSAIDAASNFIQSLKDELAATQSYSDAAQFEAKLREATKNLAKDQADAYSANAIALKQQTEAAKFENERSKESVDYTMRLSDEFEKQTAVLKRLNEAKLAGATPEYLQQIKAELEALAAIPDAVQGSARDFAERTTTGLQAVNTEIGKLTEDSRQKVQTLQDEMGQYAVQGARNMQNAMADFFYDPMSAQNENMLKKFGDTLRRMGAELMSSAVLRFLTGGFSSNGQMGGILGGLWSWISGGGAMSTAAGLVPVVGGAMAVPGSDMGSVIVNTGGNAVSSFPQYNQYLSSGASAIGNASSFLGGPSWLTGAASGAGAILGGLGIGYGIGGLIGGEYDYGQMGGAIGGGIGAAAALAAGLSALAATGVGAIAAAIVAAVMSTVKKGQPDATAQYTWADNGWTLNKDAVRNGGNLEFLGSAAKSLFAPLENLQKALDVHIPQFDLNMRQHQGYYGLSIPGVYHSDPIKMDGQASEYMQEAVKIATMRLLQQDSVTSQVADPLTKATIKLSGDIETFGKNLQTVESVRKYSGGKDTYGIVDKAYELSGGSFDAYIQKMTEGGALRTFLGELTANSETFTKMVNSFQQMESIAQEFGASVDAVHKKVKELVDTQSMANQDKLDQLLGKKTSIKSTLFGANKEFDTLAQDQTNQIADINAYNKAEMLRAKNALAYGGFTSLNKGYRSELNSILKQLKDPHIAGNPALLKQWQESWDAYWQQQIDEAKGIKNKKKREEEIKRLEELQKSMDPQAIQQVDVEAARKEYYAQQKKAVLDQAAAYAGQGASQYAAKLKEINEYFAWARADADELGISIDQLNQYQKAAAEALSKDFDNALKSFAGESISGAAAALKAIDDQEKTFEQDALALGKSLDAVHDAAEKARQKLKDDFVKSLDGIAGAADTNGAAFKAMFDQFKTFYQDAQTYGVGFDQLGAAIFASMKNLFEQMTSGIVSARASIATQIAQLRGPEAVADLTRSNLGIAKTKLADFYASGSTDPTKELALIQGVQAAVMDRYNAELALIQKKAQAEAEAVNAQTQAKLDALTAEQDAISAAATAQIEALQTQYDAAAQIRQDAHDAELQALQQQLSLANALKSAIKNIADYTRSMLTSADAPLSPQQRYENAKAEYERIAAKAKALDPEAMAQWQQAADTFRQASQAYNASSPAYAADWAKIQTDGLSISGLSVTDPDSVQAHIDELNKKIAEDNKSASTALQDQIKAIQSGAQSQIKALQDQAAAIQKAAADQIKAIQDIDNRPDTKALKDATIAELNDLDGKLATAYDKVVSQYKSFADIIATTFGGLPGVLAGLNTFLNGKGLGNAVISVPVTPEPKPAPVPTREHPASAAARSFIANLTDYSAGGNTSYGPLLQQYEKQLLDLYSASGYTRALLPLLNQMQGYIQDTALYEQAQSIIDELSALPGYARGGVPSGWSWVGEEGPELHYFDGGSRIFSNADSERMVREFSSPASLPPIADFSPPAQSAPVQQSGGGESSKKLDEVLVALQEFATETAAAVRVIAAVHKEDGVAFKNIADRLDSIRINTQPQPVRVGAG